MIPENTLKAKGRRIVVGLSGGVDSTAAALLLKRAGADARAVFMKNWRDDDTDAGCHDKQDLIAAAAAADALGLPFDVASFADEYKAQVFAPFLRELARGRTPNPDVLCNSEIKFAAFQRYARDAGADAVATGHYARAGIMPNLPAVSDSWRLYKAEDAVKDQTYFLHRLTPAQLSYSLFPIGGMQKREARQLARDAGMQNWQRKDSTGICFIGERGFDEFIARYLPAHPGAIRDENGRELGEHRGLQFYTIGQRRGLDIGGAGEAWFVYAKDADANELRVAQGNDNPLLYSRRVTIEDARWIGAAPVAGRVYAARLRHRQPPASCALTAVTDDGGGVIAFAEPQRAAAPGQYAVLYDGDLCLGGGVISGAS